MLCKLQSFTVLRVSYMHIVLSGDLKFQEIVNCDKFQDKRSFQEIYLQVVETADSDTGGAKPICICLTKYKAEIPGSKGIRHSYSTYLKIPSGRRS